MSIHSHCCLFCRNCKRLCVNIVGTLQHDVKTEIKTSQIIWKTLIIHLKKENEAIENKIKTTGILSRLLKSMPCVNYRAVICRWITAVLSSLTCRSYFRFFLTNFHLNFFTSKYRYLEISFSFSKFHRIFFGEDALVRSKFRKKSHENKEGNSRNFALITFAQYCKCVFREE